MTRAVVDVTGVAVPVQGGGPRRIVSLVPSVSETLHALGVAERVVGVTTFCIYPSDGFPAAARVRGTKNPDLAAILELAPDLVLANREENRERDIVRLREAGVVVHVSEPRTVAGAAATVRDIGALVGAEETAERMAAGIEGARAEVVEQLEGDGGRTGGVAARTGGDAVRRVAAFCPIWRRPWMAVGRDSYAADLLQTCGFHLVPPTEERYPTVELHRVRDLAEAVLLPSEPYPFSREHVAEFAGWAAQVRLVDGALLTWHGPRTVVALRAFTSLRVELAGPL